MEAFQLEFPSLPQRVQNVIGNHLLNDRPAREPDYKAQVEATAAIVKAMLETPDAVLAKLSLAVQTLTGADSAGVSLLGREAGNRILLWQAACGFFEQYLGSVVQYDDSPCGSVVDVDKVILMLQPETAYPKTAQIQPPMREVLLVPFRVHGKTVGTVWVVSQGRKAFDAEDARIAGDISELAAVAYQALTEIGDLKLLSRTVQLFADSRFST